MVSQKTTQALAKQALIGHEYFFSFVSIPRELDFALSCYGSTSPLLEEGRLFRYSIDARHLEWCMLLLIAITHVCCL